jgi:hypothetical protein
MRYLIALEPVEGGFGIQVPDLAIAAFAPSAQEAKRVAAKAISVNLEVYRETGGEPPSPQPAERHLSNPDFHDALFAYVDVATSTDKIAA